ncbi:hypothetical protein Tco_0489729 [Tanacetum coccineum]
MSASQDEIPPPPPPPPSSSQTPTQQTPQTVSTIKLPILKKGEYDIWAMKMEHYLAHTDYPIWEVIQNGNGPVSITTDTSGQIKVLPPRTAEEIVARERERKARTTLLMALPEDHLAKFHKMTDAKEMWDAIKSRFGGNDESKKMQKYILKQQFEGFSISNTEGLHKGYDRFQSLLSQLEIHGAGVSTEDANQKFLRSLPSASPGEGGGWSQVSLIMRTKPGVDSLSFDDLYNNLRVFESDIKGSTASSSSPQNVAFVSENSSSTNEVSTAYCVPNLSGQNSKYEQTSSYSLLANQSSCPQLDHEDLEQIDEYDLEEMDFEVASSHDLNEMKKGILLESVESSELKITGGEMHEILETRIGAELYRRRFLKQLSDKYCAENLKKFDFANVKTASIPIETSESPLVKDKEASDVDVHLYRYLKGKPKLGLWYPRVSSFDLESYSDSDYAGANLDRKSTTGGCQFLGRRLISWQCKKQTIVATSTTEAEYVAAASCCGQVLWIQNQMLDYGFNFMNTKIYIDNESTICIVKNPVYHSKTKHIAIRHHFIRDAYEKKLIQVLKIHTDDNVADLLTKAFDVSRFQDLKEDRESLRRVTDGTAALLLLTLFILWWTNTMAVLDSCPKHNMIAYLETTEGNVEFHEIIDFLKRSSIHHALTVSPVVSTTFVEQFWTSAKSKTINNVRHITANVAGKAVSISEASIRSDLLFDDADGIDTLPNQAIFDAIQQMGSKSTSWDQVPTNIATAVICLTSNQKYNFSKLIFDGKQLANVSVPLDHFPVNNLTSKVFSFMVKKGKHFSGKVTPLFAPHCVLPLSRAGTTFPLGIEAARFFSNVTILRSTPTTYPLPAPTSEVPYEPHTDSSPAHHNLVKKNLLGEILDGHSFRDKSLSGNEGDMTI